MTVLLSLLKIIAVVAVIFFAALFFLQERLIFFPTKLRKDYVFNFKNKFEEKWLKIRGAEVHSLLFEAPEAPGIILYFHGNGGALDSWGELASEFVDQTGWSIWMVDYPGYGKSSGSVKSEARLHEMASVLYEEVKKIAPGHKVVIYGRSLGSGLATKLAAENQVDAVVLETPYFSVPDMAQIYYPFVPSLLIRYKLSSNEWVKNIKSPILFIHGTADEVIPYSQGQELFAETPGPKEFLTIENGEHNSLPVHPEYWDGLKSFLDHLPE